MTRSQLIANVAKKTGISAFEVENVMDEVFGNIVEGLHTEGKVTIAGFGRFEMRERKTKAYVNPKTKIATQLAPTRIPGFRASNIIKKKLAK